MTSQCKALSLLVALALVIACGDGGGSLGNPDLGSDEGGFVGTWIEVDAEGQPETATIETEEDHYLWVDDDGTFVGRVDESGDLIVDAPFGQGTVVRDGDLLIVRYLGEETRLRRATDEEVRTARSTTTVAPTTIPPSAARSGTIEVDGIDVPVYLESSPWQDAPSLERFAPPLLGLDPEDCDRGEPPGRTCSGSATFAADTGFYYWGGIALPGTSGLAEDVIFGSWDFTLEIDGRVIRPTHDEYLVVSPSDEWDGDLTAPNLPTEFHSIGRHWWYEIPDGLAGTHQFVTTQYRGGEIWQRAVRTVDFG